MKRNILLSLMLSVAVFGHSQQILTLQQCRDMAIANNIAVRSSNNSIEQAKQQQKEAFTNYFPQVSATGMTFRSNKDMVNVDLGGGMAFSMLDKGTFAGVTAIQPVFAGGQIVNGNKLAKVGVEVSELQREQTEKEVLLTVEKYYWQIVSLKNKQKTVEKVSEMLNSIAKDAQVAVDAGLSLNNDLLQVKIKQNEVESNSIKLNNGLALSKMVLAQYIGLDENADIDVEGAAEELPEYPVSLKQDANSAVENTPEYHLLQKNVQATNLQHKMEVGKNLPTVGIGAGYNYSRLMGKDNDFGLVFASVSVPISSWWGGSHAIKRKKLAAENAKAQLEDNSQLLKIRIQKSWNDLDDAYKQLLIAQKSIEQSEENLRVNRNQYQSGTINMSDLLQAETLYQDCCDKYTDAYSQYHIKIIEYKQSIGI